MKFIIILCLFFQYMVFSQEPPPSKKAARGYLSFQNYQQALVEFLKLHRLDSNNVEYNHSLGLCYLETYIDRSKSIRYLEWVVRQNKYNVQAWYDLGRAYAVHYEFDKAIEAFETYIRLTNRDNNYIPAQRWIEMCKNAKEFVNKPIDVEFINLGSAINSDAPDFNPYVDQNETFLVFTTKRSGNTGNLMDFDGYYTADIMYSKMQSGQWQKAKRFSNTINSAIVEESVGMSPDGTTLFVYMENFTAIADVYMTQKKGRSFGALQPLGKNLNTRYLETSACISPDGNILFISANYPDSYGGMDIYYSIKLPNGQWGPPVNAGNVINTPYDEDFPYIAPDGVSFFFASTGHNSIGGFDIFKSTIDWKTMTFSNPENIGFPVNTPDNNYTISFTRSMRYAYISTYRPDSHGDLDIYKVIFKSQEPNKHILSGVVKHVDQTLFYNQQKQTIEELTSLFQQQQRLPPEQQWQLQAKIDELLTMLSELPDVVIEVLDASSGQVLSTIRPSRSKSQFHLVLKPGHYVLKVSATGYKTQEMTIHIPEIESYHVETELHIVLEKSQ